MFDVAPVMMPELQAASGELAAQLAVEAQAEEFAMAIQSASNVQAAPAEPQPLVHVAQSPQLDAQAGQFDLGEMIMGTWRDVDSRYEALFNVGSGVTETSPAGPAGELESGPAAVDGVDLDGPGLKTMLEHSLDVSLWSVQVNLLTSGVKRSTDGVQTLFRNSG